MRVVSFLHFLQPFFGLISVTAQLHPNKPAEYRHLPSLREQAIIQDQWRDERVSQIPNLLRKYGADAWLVSLLTISGDSH